MTANERLAEIKARVEAIRDENPYSYSPWDDDSVDPTNAGDVVHAAVSRGWDAGVKAEVPALVAALEAVLTQTTAMREAAATGYSDRTTRLILESWADEIEAVINEALGEDQ